MVGIILVGGRGKFLVKTGIGGVVAEIKRGFKDLGAGFIVFDLREFLRPNLGDLYPVVLVKDFARKHGIENFDIDNYQDNPIFIAIRRFGYIISCVFIFIFGLLPLFWILGLMVCRATKWKLALALLFISNFLKNYYLAQVYEKIGFWWFALFFVAFILTMSYIVKSIIKKLKAYNNQTAS